MNDLCNYVRPVRDKCLLQQTTNEGELLIMFNIQTSKITVDMPNIYNYRINISAVKMSDMHEHLYICSLSYSYLSNSLNHPLNGNSDKKVTCVLFNCVTFTVDSERG